MVALALTTNDCCILPPIANWAYSWKQDINHGELNIFMTDSHMKGMNSTWAEMILKISCALSKKQLNCYIMAWPTYVRLVSRGNAL